MDFITLLSQLQFHFVAVWHSKHAWLISVIHTVNTMQVFHSFINTNFVTLLSNGRPYGGCAVYFRNTLSSSISHCQIVSRRFCGIKVKLAGGHIFLVVCIYLPFDDGHASDALKFGEVLGELEAFLYTRYYDLLDVVGDTRGQSILRLSDQGVTEIYNTRTSGVCTMQWAERIVIQLCMWNSLVRTLLSELCCLKLCCLDFWEASYWPKNICSYYIGLRSNLIASKFQKVPARGSMPPDPRSCSTLTHMHYEPDHSKPDRCGLVS